MSAKPKTKKKKSTQPTIRKNNFYGFRHDVIDERFKGSLTYCNDITVHGEYMPVSIYHAAQPDYTKGHKRYMLLQIRAEGGGIVRGMTEAEIEPFRKVTAAHCLKCNTVFYSTYRHDYTKCGCKNETFVDGGSDYLRWGAKDMTKVRIVTLDILNDEITEAK